MTMDAIDFARFCGPTAVAAATGISRARAARILWNIQRDRGPIIAPGTTLPDAVIALDMLGIGAEHFDAAKGQLIESAAECLERARRTPPAQVPMMTAVAEVIAASPTDAQQKLWDFFRNRHSNKPSLRSWLQMPGLWMLGVDWQPDSHWIAARDHRVLVESDEMYLDAPVIFALRLMCTKEDLPCLNHC